MQPTTVILANTYRSNKRFGWLVPLIACTKEQGETIESAETLYKHCDKVISPHAREWLAAPGLRTTEGPQTMHDPQPLFQWAKLLGLMEQDSWRVTPLGDVWLDAWGGIDDLWTTNPLMMTDVRRKWLAWFTLLAADGVMLLTAWSCMTAQAMSLEAIGARMAKKLADVSLPSSLRKPASSIRRRLLDAQKSAEFRDILSCRVVPLVDLGIAVPGKSGTYGLSERGTDMQLEITEWLRDAEMVSTVHFRKAWYLASIVTPYKTFDDDEVSRGLPKLLHRAVTTLWPNRRKWPLDESLLAAVCASILDNGAGFEIEQGHLAIERLRERRPGVIILAQGHSMNDRHFELMPSEDQTNGLDVHDRTARDAAVTLGDTSMVSPAAEMSQEVDQPATEIQEATSEVTRPNTITACGDASAGESDAPQGDESSSSSSEAQFIAGAGAESDALPFRDGGGGDPLPTSSTTEELPIWLLDLIENHLLAEEDRPAGLPLLGASSALEHLLRRTERLIRSSPERQTERFWNRLEKGESRSDSNKVKIGGREQPFTGLYGVVLKSLGDILGTEIKTIAMLHERLLRHRDDTRDHEHRMWCAYERIKDAKTQFLSTRHNNALLLSGASADTTSMRMTLLLRDALTEGRFIPTDLARVLVDAFKLRSTDLGHDSMGVRAASIEFFAEKLCPDQCAVIRSFEVTLAAGLPRPLARALAQAHPAGHLDFTRRHDSFEEKLEIAIPHLDSTVSDSSFETVAHATIYEADERSACARAEGWLFERLEPYSLAWIYDLLDPQAIWVKAKLAYAENTPQSEDFGGTNQSVVTNELHDWRPAVDPAIMALPRLHGGEPELMRTIAWWYRAQQSKDPLIRFNCLWAGMEHLVGPTKDLAFTARLARTIVLPALRRRTAAVARETAQRFLRVIAHRQSSLDGNQAREMYDLTCMFCMDTEQKATFRLNFPFDSLRGDSTLPLRHTNLETAAIETILNALESHQEHWSKLVELTKAYTPSLSPIWEKWVKALNKRQCLRELVIEEHDHVVVQFGLCYDLRNRIQHEGDHFPGNGSSLLNEASNYLRAWLRLLIEALLQTNNHLGEAIERRIRYLQVPFEDLMASLEGNLQSKITDHERALILGS